MPKTFWTYTGRMAFSILGSVAGALIVSHFGLLHIKSEQKLEKIVFDQSDLTRYDNITQRVEAGHIAMRELKARQEADARKKVATEIAEKEALAAEEAQRARAAAAQAAAAQAERKKVAQAPKRETPANAAAAPATQTAAAPLVITPATVEERHTPARDGLEGMFDKLASGVGKIRDFVVNAVKLDKPANLPFGSASTSSESSMPVIDDLRGRLKLPAFEM
jgi:leucyl aminopeptidase (aminopeptidase T)